MPTGALGGPSSWLNEEVISTALKVFEEQSREEIS